MVTYTNTNNLTEDYRATLLRIGTRIDCTCNSDPLGRCVVHADYDKYIRQFWATTNMTPGNYHLRKEEDGYHVWCGDSHAGLASFSEVLLWTMLEDTRDLVRQLYVRVPPEDSQLAEDVRQALSCWGEIPITHRLGSPGTTGTGGTIMKDKAARLLAHKGPRNAVKLLLLTAPRNSRRLGRVYDPKDVILEVTLTAGAVLDALTKAVPVGVRYAVGPRSHEIKEG